MDTYLFSLSIVISGSLLSLALYFAFLLSDLECDFINSRDCCSKLNSWITPRLVGQLLLVAVYACTGSWKLLLCNLPVTGYMLYQRSSVGSGRLGVYDPTDIHSGGQVKSNIRNSLILAGWYLQAFFGNMYCCVLCILQGDPLTADEPINMSINST